MKESFWLESEATQWLLRCGHGDGDLLSCRAKRTFFLVVSKKKRIFVRFKSDDF